MLSQGGEDECICEAIKQIETHVKGIVQDPSYEIPKNVFRLRQAQFKVCAIFWCSPQATKSLDETYSSTSNLGQTQCKKQRSELMTKECSYRNQNFNNADYLEWVTTILPGVKTCVLRTKISVECEAWPRREFIASLHVGNLSSENWKLCKRCWHDEFSKLCHSIKLSGRLKNEIHTFPRAK